MSPRAPRFLLALLVLFSGCDRLPSFSGSSSPDRTLPDPTPEQLRERGFDPDGLRGATAPTAPAGDGEALPADLSARYALGTPVTRGILTVWPVLSLASGQAADLGAVTLEAGLTGGSVTVEELGSGTVPTLRLTNAGKVPVLALAGDVVVGGKQDRILTETRLVAPGETVEVAVNCVEQGRWVATSGTTFGYGGRAELDVRKTVRVEKDQSRTWAKVAEVNEEKARIVGDDAKAQLAPSTGTYRASLTSGEVDAKVQPLVGALLPALTGDPRAVGMVVAYGGTLTTVELYGSNAVFVAAAPSSVRSLALEAVTSSATGAAPPTTDARAFLDRTFAARVVRRDEQGASTAIEARATGTSTFVVVDAKGEILQAIGYAE